MWCQHRTTVAEKRSSGGTSPIRLVRSRVSWRNTITDWDGLVCALSCARSLNLGGVDRAPPVAGH